MMKKSATNLTLVVLGVAAAFFLLGSAAGAASAAKLDPSFGNNGTIVVPHDGSLSGDFSYFFAQAGEPGDVAVDSHGRILVGGGLDSDILVKRFLPNGSPDASFGVGGTVRAGMPDNTDRVRVREILVKADESIIAVVQLGQTFTDSHVALVHLNEDGSLNPGMSDSWLTPLNVPRAAALTKNQRILVAGWRVSEYDSTGYNALQFAGDLMKRLPDGRRDLSFAKGRGFYQFNPKTPRRLKLSLATEASSLINLPGGKLLVGGRHLNRFMVLRLTAAGLPDRNFGTNRSGRTVLNFGGQRCMCIEGSEMARDRKHRILQVGYAGSPFRPQHGPLDERATTVLVRYRPNGKLDRSFGKRGFAFPRHRSNMRPTSIAVQRNGRILVTFAHSPGRLNGAKLVVARYLPNGKPDRSFFGDGRYSWKRGSASTASKVLIDKRGRALVAGGAAIDGTGNYVLKRFLVGR